MSLALELKELAILSAASLDVAAHSHGSYTFVITSIMKKDCSREASHIVRLADSSHLKFEMAGRFS
jgi:hypothetical protein